MRDATFIRRVQLRNYKSIEACDVRLRPLMFLVGLNGAGKSNFLDALRFVSDALRNSLDHALRDRGGIIEVRRRSGGGPTQFGIRVDFVLATGESGHYAFLIGPRSRASFQVLSEECVVRGPEALKPETFFRVKAGLVSASAPVMPAASDDRLYLVSASGMPEFRGVFDALQHMGFYSLSPERMRDLQPPDAGDLLARDGSNIASMLDQVSKGSPEVKRRIERYLERLAPGVHGVQVRVIGPRETIEFHQQLRGAKEPWRFLAANMSDGTLRGLGILVALFQPAVTRLPVPLVGVEEPEMALHPAAAHVLRESLAEASRATQVLVTSHSPDLLDDATLDVQSMLAVVVDEHGTTLGPIEATGRGKLRDRMCTAGDLLRRGELLPEIRPSKAAAEQLPLFSAPAD
ncbi:MAG: AAA family ATPase [Planctomycetota bacterium]